MDFQAYWNWLNNNAAAVAAMGAVGAAIATAIYAFFTLLLWFATRRQAILTRQMFEASHSPYVGIRVDEPTDMNKQGILSFNMVVENQSPVLAHVIGWQIWATLTDLELHENPIRYAYTTKGSTEGTLAPGQRTVTELLFFDERLPNTDLPFRLVVRLTYRGSGMSICATDLDAHRGNINKAWFSQDCRMRRPEDIFWATVGYKN